ncbi:MAG: hypothetical protein QOI05_3644 [Bradyrhizobium sp.]|jgi:hypothetical protein|nr:hypothetical protein [Bradyrhizobium sp.]
MPDEQRDFFISFNSADEAYAKAISDALRAEGFTTFFHPDDIEPGGYIPKWMNDALQNSHQMLALCSPEYMAEGAVYSEAERYAWFWRDTRGEKFRLVPVVLKEVEFPLLIAGYKRLIATNTTAAEAAAVVVAALKKPEEIKERQSLRGAQPNESVRQPAYVHTTLLPETGYKRLVGRDTELERLDKAWLDAKVNILSVIAEGGAGKSALVNEWLKRMQAHNYPGAAIVLGWSFFSQGTTERATSAEAFLNWALEKLGIQSRTTSATDKADAIADAMMKSRVLLLLDGVEPLQHGPGPQLGQLKDFGLRALLRRFAATPPGAAHGLIVLTSRLAVEDVARWKNDSAPTVDVGHLSNEAGVALLRDNGLQGADIELRAAVREFDGHPLALGLLASFLKETRGGDVRRRDHIRGLLSDTDNVGHDHARRVMESYEKSWFAGQPVLLAIMHMVGLFDRPASANCLNALRTQPVIEGLNGQIVKLGEGEWQRAVSRLREVRLLAPPDPAALDALDAHPLVREWFGERLRQTNEAAWKVAHGRLFEHLRDTTKEGSTPSLEDLAPLYQAIAHGCRAGQHKEVLEKIYKNRISQRRADGRLEYYSVLRLGATGSDLAAISWFFDKPYDTPVVALEVADRAWVLGNANFQLRAQGRLTEAKPAGYAATAMAEQAEQWAFASDSASNVSEIELLTGELAAALESAEQALAHADRSGDKFKMLARRALLAEILHAAGRNDEAEHLFVDAERRQKISQPTYPILYSRQGYLYCDFLLSRGQLAAVCDRAIQNLKWAEKEASLDRVVYDLILGRAHLGLALTNAELERSTTREYMLSARAYFDEADSGLRFASDNPRILDGLLARAVFRRNIGDLEGAARDLDEVEEFAEPGPMRLYLCDMALERVRLALARMEAFAPLNGLLKLDNPPKREVPNTKRIAELKHEAEEQLKIAADYIETCGYHRRDEELAELHAVLRGEKKFADLPPRV